MSPPPATIVVPTRNRPGYLDGALASFASQVATAGAEVVVVVDGADPASVAVAERHGARVLAPAPPQGPNAARNAGIAAAHGELIVLVDDDVQAPPSWLPALLAAAAATPERDVFAGPIRAVLEGGGPRSCGRESPPITTLDHGPADCDIPVGWSANLAIRRAALETIGGFDEAIEVGAGDEEEWQERGPPPSIAARIGPAKTSRCGVAAAAASSAGSQLGGACTSSSTSTISSPCAAAIPALRAALGPCGGAGASTRAPWRSATATLAGSAPSTTTTISAPTVAACSANEASATSR